MPRKGSVQENYSVGMIEASSSGEGEEVFAYDQLMGEEPPVIIMPGSPQNWIVINQFNFELAQLDLDASRYSKNADVLAKLRAEFNNMESQLGPGLKSSIKKHSKKEKQQQWNMTTNGVTHKPQNPL